MDHHHQQQHQDHHHHHHHPKNSGFGLLKGIDAVNAELKYLASDKGKAEHARKKAGAEAKKEAKN